MFPAHVHVELCYPFPFVCVGYVSPRPSPNLEILTGALMSLICLGTVLAHSISHVAPARASTL